jgi:hypothetical protein
MPYKADTLRQNVSNDETLLCLDGSMSHQIICQAGIAGRGAR